MLYQCQNYFTLNFYFYTYVNISFMHVIFNMPVSKLFTMSLIFMYTYFMYYIAGNFRGRKFSRLSLHDMFRELNFEDLL